MTRRKRPFDIDVVMRRIRETIASSGVADAAMFARASEGYTSLFEHRGVHHLHQDVR